MIKLVIIADDFTGALDTGVQFTAQGVQTLVSTRLDLDISEVDSDIQVLVIDTESRHVSIEEAYSRVYSVTGKAKSAGVEYIFKKTDSTLRGNIGSELKAVMDAWDTQVLMFAPAYPANGRTTINGRQLVNGVPLNETPFADDPLEPMKYSYISEVIEKQVDIATKNINIDDLNCCVIEKKKDKAVYIFDSQTHNDMQLVGVYLKKEQLMNVTAGCAGFASVLAELIPFKKEKVTYEKSAGNLLAVVGSLNKASISQVEYAKKHGFNIVKLIPEEKLWSAVRGKNELQGLTSSLAALLKEGRAVVVVSASDSSDVQDCDRLAQSMNIDKNRIFSIIADSISEIIKSVMEKCCVRAIVVFGGDTAIALMKRLECTGVTPIVEIQPGVVLSKIEDGLYSLVLVTKAGGFGEDDILFEIKEFLEE